MRTNAAPRAKSATRPTTPRIRLPRHGGRGDGPSVGSGLPAGAGTLVSTVLTLVVCLTLVALSGAAVLRMTLDDGFQRATRSPQQRRALSSSAPEPPPLTAGRSPGPVPAATAREPSSFAPHAVEGRRPVPDDGGNARRRRSRRRRLRSGTLLVALLLAVGGVLALVVAVTLSLLVAALRAAVG